MSQHLLPSWAGAEQCQTQRTQPRSVPLEPRPAVAAAVGVRRLHVRTVRGCVKFPGGGQRGIDGGAHGGGPVCGTGMPKPVLLHVEQLPHALPVSSAHSCGEGPSWPGMGKRALGSGPGKPRNAETDKIGAGRRYLPHGPSGPPAQEEQERVELLRATSIALDACRRVRLRNGSGCASKGLGRSRLAQPTALRASHANRVRFWHGRGLF